jgi:membrane fusion protein (multidrug efflux system)
MKNKRMLWIVFIVAVAVLVTLPKVAAHKKSPGNSQPGKGGPIAVGAIVIKPQSLNEKIIAPGTVLASDAVEISSEIAGRLVSLTVHEGSSVRKGTLLAKINDAELQAQLLKARVSLKQVQDQETRQKSLVGKELVSREDYESAVRAVESASADMALISAQIEKTEVRAPFDGRVGLKFVSTGAYLSPGTKITTLVCNRPLKVDFSIPEKYAGRIKTGDPITFYSAGCSSMNKGSVYAIDPMIDENTRSVHVRALCSDPDSRVLPGSFAEVTLVLSENPSALMVPSPALVPDATGQKVFCVKNGKAIATSVTTGIRDSIMVETTSGLHAGDTVITIGVLLVRSGATVSVKIENSPDGQKNLSSDEDIRRSRSDNVKSR